MDRGCDANSKVSKPHGRLKQFGGGACSGAVNAGDGPKHNHLKRRRPSAGDEHSANKSSAKNHIRSDVISQSMRSADQVIRG